MYKSLGDCATPNAVVGLSCVLSWWKVWKEGRDLITERSEQCHGSVPRGSVGSHSLVRVPFPCHS